MAVNINGVKLTPLKKIENDRGKLLHMFRKDNSIFEELGEVYFSFTNCDVIKGWYRHKNNTLNIETYSLSS